MKRILTALFLFGLILNSYSQYYGEFDYLTVDEEFTYRDVIFENWLSDSVLTTANKFVGDTIILNNDTITEITPINDTTVRFRINDQYYTLTSGGGTAGVADSVFQTVTGDTVYVTEALVLPDGTVINGADTSGTVRADTLEGNVLIVQGDTIDQGMIELKDAVEAESFDTVSIYNLKLGNKYHGIAGFQDSVVVISVASTNTWYHVANAWGTLFTATHGFGISVSGDTTTILNRGDYRGLFSITFSAGAGDEIQFRVYNVTQSRQVGFHQGATGRGTASYINICFPLYDGVTAGDKYILQLENISDLTNVTVRHAAFEVVYLHDRQ